MDIPKEFEDDVQTIENIAHEGAEVVRRIQVFTRSRDDENLHPVDINSIIRDAVDMARPQWHDHSHDRGIKIDLLTDLGPVSLVKGNETELREALINLIVNSAEAIIKQGKIRIDSVQEGDRIILKVKDNGKGIPKEYQRKVFAPFFSTKGMDGSGLGLSVARKIIEMHDGEITVESIPGNGTIVRIDLPAADILPGSSVKDDQVQQTDPVKIVIIEPADSVRKLMKDMLELDGHEVSCFDNPGDAVGSLTEVKPEVIISDIGLPENGNEQFWEQVRSNQPKVHIILSSGIDDNVYREQTKGAGIELIIKKPFDIHQLRSLLEKARKKPAVQAE